MEHLIKLIEKRKEIGKTKSCKNGGNLNDLVEYRRLGDLIIEEQRRANATVQRSLELVGGI